MRNTLFICLLGCFLFAGCQSTQSGDAGVVKSTVTDSVGVRDSIITTLKAIAVKEGVDFYKKDLSAWGAHFAHTPSVYWICVEDEVTLRATGWDDLEQFVGGWMKANPVPEPDSLLRKDTLEDFLAIIDNTVAFVRYKKKRTQPDGQSKLMLENRSFQKIDGAWKIIGMTSAPGYDRTGSDRNVFVHGK